jgi:hypothetical protein
VQVVACVGLLFGLLLEAHSGPLHSLVSSVLIGRFLCITFVFPEGNHLLSLMSLPSCR